MSASKKTFRSVLLIASACALILFSCKKDEVAHGPSPVQNGGNPAVTAVPLDGGNAIGRWILTVQQVASYRNDTLQTHQYAE